MPAGPDAGGKDAPAPSYELWVPKTQLRSVFTDANPEFLRLDGGRLLTVCTTTDADRATDIGQIREGLGVERLDLTAPDARGAAPVLWAVVAQLWQAGATSSNERWQGKDFMALGAGVSPGWDWDRLRVNAKAAAVGPPPLSRHRGPRRLQCSTTTGS
jgi:hypothetical protein